MQTRRVIVLAVTLCSISLSLLAQPFIDPINYSEQFFSSTYKDSLHSKNKTTDHLLNIFVPKEFKNGNTLIVRLTGENLHSDYSSAHSYSSDLYSVSMPVGMQFVSASKKWKMLLLAIPKISSDMKDDLSHDAQLGGTALFTYAKSETLKFKFGLYYNRECFGNFFVPLAGMDWKVNEHLSFYGVLPNNYKVEYKICDRFFMGIGFRSFQRSYRLSQTFNKDFVRVKENLIRIFADVFVYKKFLLFGEASYSIGYSLLQYKFADVNTLSNANAIYSPFNNAFLFSAGIAYRIRLQ